MFVLPGFAFLLTSVGSVFMSTAGEKEPRNVDKCVNEEEYVFYLRFYLIRKKHLMFEKHFLDTMYQL